MKHWHDMMNKKTVVFMLLIIPPQDKLYLRNRTFYSNIIVTKYIYKLYIYFQIRCVVRNNSLLL